MTPEAGTLLIEKEILPHALVIEFELLTASIATTCSEVLKDVPLLSVWLCKVDIEVGNVLKAREVVKHGSITVI